MYSRICMRNPFYECEARPPRRQYPPPFLDAREPCQFDQTASYKKIHNRDNSHSPNLRRTSFLPKLKLLDEYQCLQMFFFQSEQSFEFEHQLDVVFCSHQNTTKFFCSRHETVINCGLSKPLTPLSTMDNIVVYCVYIALCVVCVEV